MIGAETKKQLRVFDCFVEQEQAFLSGLNLNHLYFKQAQTFAALIR